MIDGQQSFNVYMDNLGILERLDLCSCIPI